MDHSETKSLLKTDYTPAVLDEASKLLLKAAVYLEEIGWCQNTFGYEGPRCAIGVLITMNHSNDHIYQTARDRLRAIVGKDIMSWNDTPGRTKEEVIAKIRAAALS